MWLRSKAFATPDAIKEEAFHTDMGEMTTPDASSAGYFAGPVTALSTPSSPSPGRRQYRGPLGWMLARRRNVMIVYAFCLVLMLAMAFLLPLLPEHTYIQTPDQIVGLNVTSDGAFAGIEPALQAALPTGKTLAAEYEDATGVPGAYFYVTQTARPASAVASTVQALQTVLARELPGGPFQPAAPGSLGGRMHCAVATIFSQPATECVFADSHVAGVVVVLSDKSSQSNAVKVRQGVEYRTTTQAPGTKSSKTGQLAGGALMAVLALLATLYGPRLFDFIQANPQLQLIPSLIDPDADLTRTKVMFRVISIVLFIFGLVFFFSAL